MTLDTFLRDNTSFITAVAALIAAITALIKAYQDFRHMNAKSTVKIPAENTAVRLFQLPTFGVSILLALLAVGIFVGRSLLPPLPANVQIVSAAWDAFDRSDYLLSLATAQECVDTFGGQGLQEQELLVANNVPLPPIGSVSETQKKQIVANGILNDAATCYYIKAYSLEKLNRLDEARAAYLEVQQFPHARILDVSGSFWSPMSAAGGRIRFIESKITPVPTP